MALKIKKQTEQWIKFPDDKEIQFKLKPFTVLYLAKIPSEKDMTPELAWQIFDNSVLGWKGIQDEDGKDLKCDSKNKRLLAEFDFELLMFVVTEAMTMNKVVDEKTAKNLQVSASGEGQEVG